MWSGDPIIENEAARLLNQFGEMDSITLRQRIGSNLDRKVFPESFFECMAALVDRHIVVQEFHDPTPEQRKMYDHTRVLYFALTPAARQSRQQAALDA